MITLQYQIVPQGESVAQCSSCQWDTRRTTTGKWTIVLLSEASVPLAFWQTAFKMKIPCLLAGAWYTLFPGFTGVCHENHSDCGIIPQTCHSLQGKQVIFRFLMKDFVLFIRIISFIAIFKLIEPQLVAAGENWCCWWRARQRCRWWRFLVMHQPIIAAVLSSYTLTWRLQQEQQQQPQQWLPWQGLSDWPV